MFHSKVVQYYTYFIILYNIKDRLIWKYLFQDIWFLEVVFVFNL